MLYFTLPDRVGWDTWIRAVDHYTQRHAETHKHKQTQRQRSMCYLAWTREGNLSPPSSFGKQLCRAEQGKPRRTWRRRRKRWSEVVFRRVNAIDSKGWLVGQADLSVMDPELKRRYGLLSMCCILIHTQFIGTWFSKLGTRPIARVQTRVSEAILVALTDWDLWIAESTFSFLRLEPGTG